MLARLTPDARFLPVWLASLTTSVAAPKPFSFDDVIEKARNLAEEAYERPAPKAALPEPLGELTYDQYRAIRNRESGRLWKENSPFRLELIHSGYLFRRPVMMNEVLPDGTARRVEFDKERYDYDDLVLEQQVNWDELKGYAGFRVQFPLNGSPEQWDEIASFVGASYFRVLGQDQRWGISARALALNVAEPDEKEEFPDFVEYWLVRPGEDDRQMMIYALLDSPSVTGAFQMLLVPGVSTQVDVNAKLFFREEVKSLGIAPLTSMFFYGENSRELHFPGWRPEVHDSDGLLVETEDREMLWRPLSNTRRIRYSAFNTGVARGYGLLQRDRNFFHYQDLDNPYHKTPSYWIETRDGWPKGQVRLIELPTKYEAFDNIVAFFQPDEMPQVGTGESMDLSYILHAKMHFESNLSREHIASTQIGVDDTYPDTRRIVIDFQGPTLESLDRHSQVYAVIDSTPNGYITENRCFKNEETGGWRVTFKLDTDDNETEPVEMRCFLKLLPEEKTLTETWTYQWRKN
ncbi:MAG: glucan biosynthesis protein G [Verrucomicrobiota bacterium JB023]|nr:glucan biosynthesis protein G [Verrucomicrobiota bacterium JB023]